MINYRPVLILAICSAIVGCYASTNLDNRVVYDTPDDQKLADGQALYQDYCQSCHGEDMTGNGPEAASLEKKPADLTAQGTHVTQVSIKVVLDYPHYSHEVIEDRIKYGNSEMPPLRDVLSNREIDLLTNYIGFKIREKE